MSPRIQLDRIVSYSRISRSNIRGRPGVAVSTQSFTSSSSSSFTPLFNPTDDHAQLRSSLRNFVQREVEPQALSFNRDEIFNRPLFTKMAQGI